MLEKKSRNLQECVYFLVQPFSVLKLEQVFWKILESNLASHKCPTYSCIAMTTTAPKIIFCIPIPVNPYRLSVLRTGFRFVLVIQNITDAIRLNTKLYGDCEAASRAPSSSQQPYSTTGGAKSNSPVIF